MRENRQLELKKDIANYRALNKELVAFLNDIGGEVIIGIDDKGGVIGLSETRIEQLLEEIPQAIFDGISPYCRPEISVVNKNDKQILSVKVFPGNKKPYFLKSKGIPKGVFIRVASHSMPVNEDIIDDLQRSNTSISYDQEALVGSRLNDFDHIVLKSHYGVMPTEEQLLADKILVLDPVIKQLIPSVSGCLFFHKTPHKVLDCAEVLFSKFNGNNMDELIKTKDYSGPLVQMANEVIEDLKKELQQIGQLESAQLKQEVKVLPVEALREAINNALIHRKYFIKDSIKIALFSDRIEIYSPGNFPGPITDFYSGVSYTRNPTIRQLARNINLVEKRGLGFRKIFDSCLRNKNPEPIITDSYGDFVKVTIFFVNSESFYRLDRWPEEVKDLNHFFATKKNFTLSQAAEVLGCSKNTAKKRIQFLIDNSLIEAAGNGPSSRFDWK